MDSTLLVLDYGCAGSSLPLRSLMCFGSLLSIYGLCSLDPSLSSLDLGSSGSVLSVRSPVRPELLLFVFGLIRLGFILPTSDFCSCGSAPLSRSSVQLGFWHWHMELHARSPPCRCWIFQALNSCCLSGALHNQVSACWYMACRELDFSFQLWTSSTWVHLCFFKGIFALDLRCLPSE